MSINTENLPLVSIVAVCYNQAPFVKEALDSILAQTYPNIELIVTDDASQDNSVEVINSWLKEKNVQAKRIFNQKNLGICRTLNIALTEARGEFMTLLASDDILLPHAVEEKVKAFRKADSNCALVYSDVEEIDAAGNLISSSFLSKWGYDTDNLPRGDNLFPQLLKRNFIPAVSVMLRMDHLKEIGGYDENLAQEDVDTWYRIAKKHRIEVCPGTHVKYRRHNASTTKTRKLTIYESHLKMYSKYIGSENKKNTKLLRDKIMKIAITIYRLGGNLELITSTLKKIRIYNPKDIRIWMLEFYLRLGLPKRLIGHIFR